MQWPVRIRDKRRVSNRRVCQICQQIPGQQGRQPSPGLVAWQQGTGTVCPQTDEPITLAHLKPPFLIRQAFSQSWFGCWVYKAELGCDFLMPQEEKEAFHSEVTFSFHFVFCN